MLKFFRQIRQNLISQNKLSKYLFYAIGEIILVVIGILIALYINNNNEIKKDKVLEQQYKERLITQFQKDSINLFSFNKAFQFIVPYLKNMDSLMTLRETNRLNPDSIVKIPVFLTLQSQFITETTVVDELNNTGNMALITSIELKDALVAYQNAVIEQINMFNNTSLKNSEFDNYLIKHGELINSFYNIQAKYINNEFYNRYWFVAANRKGFFNTMTKLETKSNQVLTLLRQ
jgi:hypothetical protein